MSRVTCIMKCDASESSLSGGELRLLAGLVDEGLKGDYALDNT